jgi:hypothetical protein
MQTDDGIFEAPTSPVGTTGFGSGQRTLLTAATTQNNYLIERLTDLERQVQNLAALLNGRDGANGANGINGRDGRDGVSGINGVNGANGINETRGNFAGNQIPYQQLPQQNFYNQQYGQPHTTMPQQSNLPQQQNYAPQYHSQPYAQMPQQPYYVQQPPYIQTAPYPAAQPYAQPPQQDHANATFGQGGPQNNNNFAPQPAYNQNPQGPSQFTQNIGQGSDETLEAMKKQRDQLTAQNKALEARLDDLEKRKEVVPEVPKETPKEEIAPPKTEPVNMHYGLNNAFEALVYSVFPESENDNAGNRHTLAKTLRNDTDRKKDGFVQKILSFLPKKEREDAKNNTDNFNNQLDELARSIISSYERSPLGEVRHVEVHQKYTPDTAFVSVRNDYGALNGVHISSSDQLRG